MTDGMFKEMLYGHPIYLAGDYMLKCTCKNVVKIKDYKVVNDTVVIVTFSDGTTEKAVCSPEDTFDLERAIEICLFKKMIGGTKAYNNAIKSALKQVAAIDEQKKADKEEAERIAKRKAKDIERKMKRKEKIRQEQINIQAEAFLKAMQMYDEQFEEVEEIEEVVVETTEVSENKSETN